MKYIRYITALILGAFGLLTLFLSGSVIFDLFGIREMEGNYVLFVVVANFIASFLYLLAVYGFVTSSKWTFTLLLIATLILVATFVGLVMHINSGGIYETKTYGAMIFRSSITAVFAIIAYFTVNKEYAKT